jgi:hypothetical protein
VATYELVATAMHRGEAAMLVRPNVRLRVARPTPRDAGAERRRHATGPPIALRLADLASERRQR